MVIAFEESDRTGGSCRGLFRCSDLESPVGTEERHEQNVFGIAVTGGGA